MCSSDLADGYTILIASNQVTINPGLGQKTPFDIAKDFSPVALIASVPMLLAVHPSVKAATLAEFISEAKAAPGRFNHSTPGSGTPQHLAFEVLNQMAGIQVTHVPYKGTGPAIADLIGGQVQSAIGTMASMEPHVKAGKMRALGVTTAKRSQAMPDVPTIAEAALPGYAAAAWYGIVGPAGLPPNIVNTLNGAALAVLGMNDVKARLFASGVEVRTSTPDEFARLIDSEIIKWAKVVKDSGAKAE